MPSYFRSHRQQQLLLLAFFIPFAIMLVLFIDQQLTPFGNRNLLFSDVGTQYNVFLTSLRHDILQHNFSQYSYSLGLGSNTLPTYAYYLMSPLNILVVFFPPSQMPTAIAWLIVLKISLSGLTMAYFLSASPLQYKKNPPLLLFSTAYALSSWVASVYYTLMWLDALLLLPLVCAGLDRLIQRHTSKLYFISLLAIIITNYYLGYMACLFAVIYFVYQLSFQYCTSEGSSSFLKRQKKLILHFILTSLLAALSSMFILLPSILGMLATDKAIFKWSNYNLMPTFGPESLNQLGLGANNYSSRLSHGPALFSGSCIFLLIIAFFLNKRVDIADKKRTAAVLLTLFLGMWVNCFNTIWHLFQHPAGFPFRNALFFTFFAVYIAYRSVQYVPRNSLTVFQKRITLCIPLTGLFIGFIWKSILNERFSKILAHASILTGKNWLYFSLSIGFYILSWFFLFKLPLKKADTLLIGLTCIELMLNFTLSMVGTPFGNQHNYVSNYCAKQHQLANLKHNNCARSYGRTVVRDTSFRNAYHEKYNYYNDALLFHYYGISFYSSTLNKEERQTLEALGYLSVNPRRISFVGGTELTRSLLSIQNELKLSNTSSQLKVNPTFFGVGAAVPAGILKLKLPQYQALKNQERILQNFAPSSEPYFKHVKLLKIHDGVKSSAGKYRHELTLKTTADGPLYYYSQDAAADLNTLQVNKSSKKPPVDNRGQRMICSLGNFHKNQIVHLSVATNSLHWDNAQQLRVLNTIQFDKAMNQMYEQHFHLQKISSHALSGKVTGTAGKKSLLLSIPYEKGWHAYVNHRSVKIQKGLGGFIVMPIAKGKNYVELNYRSPGFISGIFLSGIGLLLYIATLFYEQRYSY
ncbi:integral membrane protein [Liquorilactobacillus sucicola DSM 21376 = JCM 15457]|uniref:Integral membrane protein n=1 Tax=Liquorilactobacillus sucicola DSM 21376 = JCM 15457 TaxID=1423806 RepID=A0A023CV17_9LACO|nr:YfhO family protein [Liquorilactobacillus sucicola]KRN05324.1 hypothetical protein FD15_GL001875 [Liquorilactobacillus sucicola DSM 21376 = JCM 15457]GAJ25390.1 integral membrane protein [Liquorilactobacillus sucicola DSM 21376 = JCM 15457]